MIRQFISLYRARKDSELAKRIATEMVVDGAIDRMGWPLAIIKFWMIVGIIGLTSLTLLSLAIGTAYHWTAAIPALPLTGIIYGVVKLWRGLNAGVERVTQLAKIELTNRTAAMSFPTRVSDDHPNAEN